MGDRRTGLLGLLLAVLSAAAFGTAGVFAAGLLDAGWSAGSAVTVRMGLAALALTAPAALQLRGRWSLLRANAGAVLAFGALAVALPQLAYFSAVARLSVGVALLLEYSAVLLVVLWTWARLGQRPSAVTSAGVVVALAGLVLVLDVAGGARLDPVGIVWGLVAALGLAAYFAPLRPDRGRPPAAGQRVGGPGRRRAAARRGRAGPRRPLADGGVRRRVRRQVDQLAGAGPGPVAARGGVRLRHRDRRRPPPGVAAQLLRGARRVLFAVVFAWLALGQRPGTVQLVGGIVVLAGIVLVRLGERPAGEPTGAVVPDPVGTPVR